MSNTPNSFRKRLIAFYEANPDEELTHPDLAVKFSVSAFTVRDGVSKLVKEGLIESVHVVRLPSKGIAK